MQRLFFHFNKSWGLLLAILCGQQEKTRLAGGGVWWEHLQTRRLPRFCCLRINCGHTLGLFVHLPVAPIAGPRPDALWSLHHFCASFSVSLAPGGGRCHSCAPGTTLTAKAENWKGLAFYPPGGPQAEIEEWD